MKSQEIKGATVRLGLKQQDIANALGISVFAYRKILGGETKCGFDDRQKKKLAEIFGWSYEQLNEYLYDNLLPMNVKSC